MTFTSLSLSRLSILHKGDRFRLVASHALNYILQIILYFLSLDVTHSSLVLVEERAYLTELQAERQWPHWDWGGAHKLLEQKHRHIDIK